jgi:hypothetical protein
VTSRPHMRERSLPTDFAAVVTRSGESLISLSVPDNVELAQQGNEVYLASNACLAEHGAQVRFAGSSDSRPDFHYDDQSNTYERPGGKKLTSTGRPTTEGTVLFRARNQDCGRCPLKQLCCPNTANRTMAHSIYEEARAVARAVCVRRNTSKQSRKLAPSHPGSS